MKDKTLGELLQMDYNGKAAAHQIRDLEAYLIKLKKRVEDGKAADEELKKRGIAERYL